MSTLTSAAAGYRHRHKNTGYRCRYRVESRTCAGRVPLPPISAPAIRGMHMIQDSHESSVNHIIYNYKYNSFPSKSLISALRDFGKDGDRIKHIGLIEDI